MMTKTLKILCMLVGVGGFLPSALFSFEHPSNYAPQVKVPVVLKLKGKVQIESSRINLNSIATCAGIEMVCEEGGAIDLGAAPEPGRSLSLFKKQIEVLLEQEWPDVKASVEGPSQIVIEALAEDVNVDDVKNEVVNALQSLIRIDETVQFEIQDFKIPSGLKKRSGIYQYGVAENNPTLTSLDSLLSEPSGQTHRINMQMWPEDESSGDMKQFSVTMKLVVKRYIPVANRMIHRGESLKEDSVKMEWIPIRSRFDEYFAQRDQVIGKFAKAEIYPNQPISRRTVDTPDVVQRGQVVNVHFKTGELSILTKGKILKSAKLHQDTEVFFPTTKKTMRVKVVSADEVEVIY